MDSLFDNTPGQHRRGDHSTSKRAARGIKTGGIRRMVLAFIVARGDFGATDDQLWECFGGPESSCRKRRTELASESWCASKLGDMPHPGEPAVLVRYSGVMRLNRMGQPSKVWVATPWAHRLIANDKPQPSGAAHATA